MKALQIVKDFIKVAYGGDKNRFQKEYKALMGKEYSFESPSAGIVVFLRKKWGLSSDALLRLPEVIEGVKNRNFRHLKNKSNAYFLVSSVLNFLKLLEKEELISANRLDYKSQSLDPKLDAERFIEFYGLSKDEINSFEKIREILEERDIFVFSLPINHSFHEGIVYVKSPVFIVLSSYIRYPKASFSLAHEVGHLVYSGVNVGSGEEERLADKFATHLVVPDGVLDLVKSLKSKASRISYKNRFFIFASLICKEFDCKVAPEVALAKLFYCGEINYPEFEKWRKKLLTIQKRYKNPKVSWIKKWISSLGVSLPKKYKEAVDKLNVSPSRKEEMLFARILNSGAGEVAGHNLH